jgi:membrane protein
VHVRAWGITLPRRQADQTRYAAVLLGLYGLILLLLVQLNELAGRPSWAGLAVAPGWVALLVVFFVWAPRLLTHDLISRRDLLPGAALTAVGLVVLMILSSFVIEFWVNLYARDYGGFGVVMAIFSGSRLARRWSSEQQASPCRSPSGAGSSTPERRFSPPGSSLSAPRTQPR